jgi:hypothetical protein
MRRARAAHRELSISASPETGSRVLGRMQQARVIRVARRELEFLDSAEIEKLAESVLRG